MPRSAAPVTSNQPTPRQRIEGTWVFEKWLAAEKLVQAPDVGGVFSLHDGISVFELNLHEKQKYIFCIGYYRFTEHDTVLTIGWNRCSKWTVHPEGITADFEDEWDGMVPVMKIEPMANGDLSLKYNTDNEHHREANHGGFGWDFTFHPDETLEYWNMGEYEGKKDNVKFFRKVHAGDPSLHF